ncbi:MAG: chloride channel protein [Acidimicrobiales bacterium]
MTDIDLNDERLALPPSLRGRLRSLGVGASERLRTSSYLQKWLFIGVLLGVIAGLGAVVFYSALLLATHLFLAVLAGYQVPTPAGEGLVAGSAGFVRPWVIPLVTTLGGLISGVLVFTFAPEAEGHGTDAAISAVHDNPRGIRLRAVLVKIVASAITIGSGGSGGREGPTAQISAGFGSFLARVLDLSPSDGRIAVAVGIGSGIGSIFGAPLGGALLAAEIIYKDDFEVEAILPGFVASIIGYAVFSAFEGFQPLFGFAAPGYHFHNPAALGWFALIGIVSAAVALGYAKSFYGLAALFQRLPGARLLRPALGGLLVGCLALGIPEVLGTGYGWIQRGLGHQLLGLPLWVVLAMPLAKILATSLSIGSGGSGGIFGPGLVTGAFTGAAIWRLLEPIAPGIPASPAPFVIVGMMACFGSISRAPVAVMIMVAEMTGTLAVLAPAMVAVGLATLIVTRADDTIYRSQLQSRQDSPAHRLRVAMPLLSALRVSDVMTRPRVIFDARNEVGEAADKLRREGLRGAPVVDQAGAFIGTVSLARLDKADQAAEAGRLADPAAPTTVASAHLDSALESLMNSGNNWVPVLGDGRKVVGVLPTSALVRSYRDGLRNALRQIGGVSRDTGVVDVQVGANSFLAGQSLADAGLPPGTIVMTIQRDSQLVLPRGGTVLQVGDRVGALTRGGDAEAVRALLSGAPPEPEPPPERPPEPPPEPPADQREGPPPSHDSNPSSTSPSSK